MQIVAKVTDMDKTRPGSREKGYWDHWGSWRGLVIVENVKLCKCLQRNEHGGLKKRFKGLNILGSFGALEGDLSLGRGL